MIIPSIDLQGGHAVQLVGGKERALEAGDPRPIARRFALAGDVAVVDLDAAMGEGDNAAVMEELCALAPCRVGGGIRDAKTALRWLDAGATQVVLGTAAQPEVLAQLPPERVIVALDALHGEVMVHGWKTGTGTKVLDRMRELRPYCGGFLITVIEREGRLAGIDEELVKTWVEASEGARVTVAGGVRNAADVAALDRLGADAQVGMALYTGKLDLADAMAAPLITDRPDGRWPTVVAGEHGEVLGLAYSDGESLREAVSRQQGVYSSRSRGLWIKGEGSGATQELLRVDLDCDRDCLRFTVRQQPPGFCHQGTASCFGEARGLPALDATLRARREEAPEGSYTRRLFEDPALLAAKLREEVEELIEARTPEEVRHEVADVLYFAMVAATRAGVSLAEVEATLDLRRRRVSRRPGDAKPPSAGARP